MIKFRLQIFTLVTFSLLFSCKEEIPFDFEPTDRKIVLNTLMAVDSNLWAYVYLSNHVATTGRGNYALNNASVSVYSNNEFIENLVLQSNGYYRGMNHIIEANREYEYRVSAEGYNSVSATATTLNKTSILSIDSIGIKRLRIEEYSETQEYFAYTIQFQDEGNVDDFYRISISNVTTMYDTTYWDPYYGDTIIETIYPNYYSIYSVDPSKDDDFGYYDQSMFYITDRLFDGEEYAFEILIPAYSADGNTLEVSLEHLSNDYYNYIKTSQLQSETIGFEMFFQAVQVFNNVENGFGIIGTSASSKGTFYFSGMAYK